MIAGHGSMAAAALLELVEVPCIVLSGLTENQKKAYRIADNRIPLNAGWDEALLSEELAELASDGFGMESVGFTQDELDKLLAVALHGDDDGMDIPFDREEAKSGVSVQYLSFGNAQNSVNR